MFICCVRCYLDNVCFGSVFFYLYNVYCWERLRSCFVEYCVYGIVYYWIYMCVGCFICNEDYCFEEIVGK